MQEISVHDKVFTPYLSEASIQARVLEMGKTLTAHYEGKNPLFICILNGAFIFAADLIRAMEIPTEIQFVRVSSYGSGMESSGEVKKVLNLEADIRGRHLVIVEDIVDTGNTLDWLRGYFGEKEPASISIVCLLFKKDAYKYKIDPEFIGFSIPNEFVVGYGLDYAEYGRGVRSIYKIKSE